MDAVPHIRRFAYSLTRNAADADDLVQSVVERILQNGTPEDVDLKKWMFRVCRNRWIDTLRASKVRQTAEPEIEEASAPSPSSEDVAGSWMMMNRVQSAIAALPDNYREVLTVVAVGGASYKEAASMLKVPIGTIMSRLGRARAMVAEEVGYHD